MKTAKGFKLCAALSIVGTSVALAFASTGWSLTAGEMISPRAAATITTLQNGKVLLAGGKAGLGSFPVLNSAELYNPATGTFTATGSMAVTRHFATATLLFDGRVLVAGGRMDNGVSTATAEIYDPASGAWTTTGSMATTRVRHSAVLLPNGRVLVAGGLDDTAPAQGQIFLKSAEIYDPATGYWSPAESMSNQRYGFAMVVLNDWRVLAIGGAFTAGDFIFNRSAEIFDPLTGHWSATHQMSEGRAFFPAVVLADGRVLAAGGSVHTGGLLGNIQTDTAEIYDPSSGTWSQTQNLGIRRTGARAVALNNGRVLLTGGNLYDLDGNGINLRIVDRAVVAGAEVWDPLTGAWTPAGAMSEGRTAFMMTKLGDGSVIAAGGFGLTGVARSSADLFN